MALDEEMCLLEDELLMLCWLLWEDTELGRPCWERQELTALVHNNIAIDMMMHSIWSYLVVVRHGLASHAGALPSLGHGRDAVGGQRVLLAMSSMWRLHHGVSTILLLLLLLLLLTAWRTGKIGTTNPGLKEGRGWTEKDKTRRRD